MKLEKLYYCYGLDTSCFYTDEEKALEQKIARLKQFKAKLKQIENRSYKIQSKTVRSKYKGKAGKEKLEQLGAEFSDRWYKKLDDAYGFKEVKRYVNQQIIQTKNDLIAMQKANMNLVRTARYDKIYNKYGKPSIKRRVSIFDSVLTRCLGLKEREFNTEIVIVAVFFFPVAENILHNGFIMNGEKYVFFSASAGQIRTKKFVAVREDLLKECWNTLTAGLTVERINECGGININKFLSYLSLCNSGTEEWKDFDIDRTIVVDDFETNVLGEVDFIDDVTFEIKRETECLPIAQMDGCGIMLPSVMNVNTMVRLPWVKGLLASYDFKKFIEDNNVSPMVTDIYGDKHNVIEEDIQIIFTKSQFKCWKYFPNWFSYKENFKKYHCQAALCNKESGKYAEAVTSYQMMQTLADLSDEEILDLISENVKQINDLSTKKEVMMKTMGIVNGKPDYLYNGFQKCIKIYPELLSDLYCRKTIKDLKRKLETEMYSGKFMINGRYTFVVPDLYAFCEWLFLGIEVPEGKLKNGEVCCRLFKHGEKLDCLRSPHLYCEHPIRVNRTDIEEFYTNAIYVSSHDFISRIVQLDWDGDCLLLSNNKTLINAAERNMKDKVPLYYIMKKANVENVTTDSLWKGLTLAFTGGNIGEISNSITKIWNSGKVTSEKVDFVKLLTALNNYVIDYAKVLYKPKMPKPLSDRIHQYTNRKVPRFFVYAKGKPVSKTEEPTDNVIDRIAKLYKPKSLSFSFKNDNIGKFDYRTLLNGTLPDNAEQIVERYKEVVREQLAFHKEPYDDSTNNYLAVYDDARSKIVDTFPDNNIMEIVDSIVYDIFEKHKSVNKKAFWTMFGDIVYENIKNNLHSNSDICQKCGKRYLRQIHNQKYCPKCQGYIKRRSKIVMCCDCGKEFSVRPSSRRIRCDDCHKAERRRINRNNYKD